MAKLAVVQHPPVLLDKTATLQRAATLVAEAASRGATVVVFPEAFVPGYPTWIWRLRPGGDMRLSADIHARLLANAVNLPAGDLDPIGQAAKEHAVTVVCGVHEIEPEYSRGTLYNAVVVIGPDGVLRNRHRKLMPTNPERMVWGLGDGSGLRVVDSPCGRLGTLICWENYMPLARFALYAAGIEVYVAPTWDNGDGWIGTLQHIGREGRCWVVGSGSSLCADDIPAEFPGRAELYPDREEWINAGDSVVVDPAGNVVAGPLRREHGILYADVDPRRVAEARRSLDVAGHYARPDIFQLRVNTAPQAPAVFVGAGGAEDPRRADTSLKRSTT